MLKTSQTNELSPQAHQRAIDGCAEIVALADHLAGHAPIHDTRCVKYAEVISRLASDVRGALLGVVALVLVVAGSGCGALQFVRDNTNTPRRELTAEEVQAQQEESYRQRRAFAAAMGAFADSERRSAPLVSKCSGNPDGTVTCTTVQQ